MNAKTTQGDCKNIDFKEFQRLKEKLRQLNNIIEKAPPSAYNPDEWDKIYDEAAEISEKLYDPSDQSRQEKALGA